MFCNNFADLYQKIVNHSLDPLEPFILPQDQKDAPIKVQIGKEEAGRFQDIPAVVMLWLLLEFISSTSYNASCNSPYYCNYYYKVCL